MKATWTGQRPWLLVVGLLILGALFTFHSLQDYFTVRDVAHNGDVIAAVCRAQNHQTRAIRAVLMGGIRAARRGEKVLPQFKAQYEDQIRQSRFYLAHLFVVRRC